jgi:hypothetical protein
MKLSLAHFDLILFFRVLIRVYAAEIGGVRVYAAEIGGVRRFWGGTRQNFVYALASRSEPGARCCVLSLRGVVHSGAQCCA